MYSQNNVSTIDEDAFRMFEEMDPVFCYRNVDFMPSNLYRRIFGKEKYQEEERLEGIA